MKRLGLICLILIIATGSLGVTYASWSQNLTVNSTISTGTFSIKFYQAVTNDDGTANNIIDPIEEGNWNWDGRSELSAGDWIGNRRTDGNNDASTIVSGVGTSVLSIAMNGAYPHYWSSVACILRNTGTFPIKVNAVNYSVTPPSGYTSSDISVYFTGSLAQGNQTSIAPGTSALGSVDIYWNHVPSVDALTYTLTVNINAVQQFP